MFAYDGCIFTCGDVCVPDVKWNLLFDNGFFTTYPTQNASSITNSLSIKSYFNQNIVYVFFTPPTSTISRSPHVSANRSR